MTSTDQSNDLYECLVIHEFGATNIQTDYRPLVTALVTVHLWCKQDHLPQIIIDKKPNAYNLTFNKKIEL